MTQGHFRVRSCNRINTHAQLSQKLLGAIGNPFLVAPQAPSDEISPTGQLLSERAAPRNKGIQLENIHLMQTPGGLQKIPWDFFGLQQANTCRTKFSPIQRSLSQKPMEKKTTTTATATTTTKNKKQKKNAFKVITVVTEPQK